LTQERRDGQPQGQLQVAVSEFDFECPREAANPYLDQVSVRELLWAQNLRAPQPRRKESSIWKVIDTKLPLKKTVC